MGRHLSLSVKGWLYEKLVLALTYNLRQRENYNLLKDIERSFNEILKKLKYEFGLEGSAKVSVLF